MDHDQNRGIALLFTELSEKIIENDSMRHRAGRTVPMARFMEHEQGNSERATYGKDTMRQLSKALTKELGKGFSLSNVYNMRQFYLDYPKFQSLTGKLTWTHYCELMSISDKDRRSFYEKECEKSGWSVRELKRQISTSLFERLLLSDGDASKEKVYELATQGQELSAPEDIIKDPYVFEFLCINIYICDPGERKADCPGRSSLIKMG